MTRKCVVQHYTRSRCLREDVSIKRAIRHVAALKQARDRLDNDLTEAQRRLSAVIRAQAEERSFQNAR